LETTVKITLTCNWTNLLVCKFVFSIFFTLLTLSKVTGKEACVIDQLNDSYSHSYLPL